MVATRFVLMGVLRASRQLQSLGTAASSPSRVGAVKWLGGRPLVRQTARDFAELHYVVVDAATFAAVVFDDHVLWRMMCPERVRRQVERAERP